MATLYLNESGSVVGVDGGYYVVKQKNDLLRKIPKETLEAITLFGNVHLTEPCVQECLRHGIAVNYFSAKGAYFGRLTSTRHIKAERLRMQVHFSENEEFCLEFAKKIVAAKIHNQMVVCRRYQRNKEAEDCLRQMKLAENKISCCQSREEVMGYEGIAAREYFKALAQLVQPAFRFNGRTRMPPKDAFNSMLSLGYTMLLYEIYGELENRGLTPYIGLLHKDQEGHPALASDLMEEWRSVIVDSVVLSLVQGNEVSVSQFVKDEETGGIFLTKEAMRIFVRKMEIKMRSENRYLLLHNEKNSVRRCLYLQSVCFLRMLQTNDLSQYEPIWIR